MGNANLIALLTLLLAIPLTSKAQQIYTIRKGDIVAQFSDSTNYKRLICYKEDSTKVFVKIGDVKNEIVNIWFSNGEVQEVWLSTIKVEGDTLEAAIYNFWHLFKKMRRYPLDEVLNITIRSGWYYRNSFESTYFDVARYEAIQAAKNDSIKKLYSNGSMNVLVLHSKDLRPRDSTILAPRMAYHLRLVNGTEIWYGIIQEVSADSIRISNAFNEAAAAHEGKEYRILTVSIKDIAEFKFRKPNNFFNIVKLNKARWTLRVVPLEMMCCPNWYGLDYFKGKIQLETVSPRVSGFEYIHETDGVVYTLY